MKESAMSEKPKNMQAYLNSRVARYRKELQDKIQALESSIEVAKRRKEYHTTLELEQELYHIRKELQSVG
jgi:hypothetical protein